MAPFALSDLSAILNEPNKSAKSEGSFTIQMVFIYKIKSEFKFNTHYKPSRDIPFVSALFCNGASSSNSESEDESLRIFAGVR